MRESVDVRSLRYTSIYSKLRAARRENCFVTFCCLCHKDRDDMNDTQHGREEGETGWFLWWMGGCGECWPASLSFLR